MSVRQSDKNFRLISALFLFNIIFGIYLLCYNGIPTSDDEHLFISASINQARIGKLSASQLLGNDRLAGNYYGIGSFHVAIGSVLYRLIDNTSLGGMQVMYFAAPIYTALSAVLLFMLSQRWGYSLKTGVFAACVFGLATISWVYSKTFYREPLAMLLLIVCWFCYDTIINDDRYWNIKILAWCIFLFAWICILLTKIMVGVVPIFFVSCIIWNIFKTKASCKKKPYMYLCIFFLSMVILICCYFFAVHVMPDYFTNRVSDELIIRVWERINIISHKGFFKAIIGSLFSPGKGFFIYSPVLLIGFFSTIHYWRENYQNIVITWGTLICLTFIQCLIYDDGWWSVSWGTRYLLPAVPGFILISLPVFENAINSIKEYKKFIIGVLTALNCLLMIGGVIISDPTYNAYLYHSLGKDLPDYWFWLPHLSPLTGHWSLIFSNESWDVAFARNYSISKFSVLVVLSLLLLAIGISALFLIKYIYRKNRLGNNWCLAGIFITALELIFIPYRMLVSYSNDPRYYADRLDLKSGYKWVGGQFESTDTMLIDAYLSPAWYYTMNFNRISSEWYSLPISLESNKNGALNETVEGTIPDYLINKFEELESKYERLWYIEECENDRHCISVANKYLMDRYPIMDKRTFRISNNNPYLRIFLFDLIDK